MAIEFTNLSQHCCTTDLTTPFDRFPETPIPLLKKLDVSVKHPSRLAMTSLAHCVFSPLAFSIDQVERDPVMFPTLPKLRQAVIRAIIARHRIRHLVQDTTPSFTLFWR